MQGQPAAAGQRRLGQRDRGRGQRDRQGRGQGRQGRGQPLPPRVLGPGALHLQRAEDRDLVPEPPLPLGNFETETAQGRGQGRGSALKEAGAGADCLRVEPDYSPGWGQPLVLGPQMLALIVL